MKNNKLKNIFIVLIFIGFSFGCTDLDVDIVSELTPENYPRTSEDFAVISGPVYRNLGHNWFREFFMLQELSADGMILTANGGHWYDGARYKQFGLHEWNSENALINTGWSWSYNGINRVNQIFSLFELVEDSAEKDIAIAELRVMRALYYFFLMDLFGDVPLITEFGQSVGDRDSRTDIFNFVVTEVEESLPLLSERNDASTYNRVNKWVAHTLLAKVYLNAEVFTGQSMYDKAVEHCDAVISEAIENGTFALDDDYWSMFKHTNGPHIDDFILAARYDRNFHNRNQWARFWLPNVMAPVYGITTALAGNTRAWPEYYDLFTEDPDDERINIWLDGPVYYQDGTPLIVNVSNSAFDGRYDGPDPDARFDWHVEFSREIEFRNVDNWDTGDDYFGWTNGYRCNKFEPHPGQREIDNDWPIFRYADVLLMKAEAILQGGPETIGQTALSLVNQVRARSNASPFIELDMQMLQDERARELAYEGWRRQDLIRWGRFEESWGTVKTSVDPTRRLFPVPFREMQLNPQWDQNPGY